MAKKSKFYPKLEMLKLKSVFLDPGIVIAVGNAFLLGQSSTLSFLIIFAAILIILLSKIKPLLPKFYSAKINLPQRQYFALEVMGYACILSAALSVVQKSIYGLICGLCFGYSNLILATRFEKRKQSILFNRLDEPILSYWLLTLIKEPIVLISIGMIHSGLSGGSESLWVMPIMVWAPTLLLLRPNINQAQIQLMFAICSFWYVIVAGMNKNFMPMIANACFTISFSLIAWHENNLSKKRT